MLTSILLSLDLASKMSRLPKRPGCGRSRDVLVSPFYLTTTPVRRYYREHAQNKSLIKFAVDLHAMTMEKLQFALPAVFTIGPSNDFEALKKYAMLLAGKQADSSHSAPKGVIRPGESNHVRDIVKGIIEGETRVIISGMTMEQVFKERKMFKDKVIENVQHELEQFGLRIYNANVKELRDAPGSEYFAFLSRKAHEGASNQARIDVAEARMRGEIGESEKKGRTKQEISKIDADTAVLETKRKSEKAKADAELTTKQTELDRDIQLAQIAARRQAEMRDAELQKGVEQKKAETELERLRATDVTKSKIAREVAQQKADAAYYTEVKGTDGGMYAQSKSAETAAFRQTKEAEATYFRQTKEAEGAYYRQVKEADASFYARQKQAEADVYAKQKEAEGIAAKAKAYGALADVLGGPQGLMQYLMLENDTYVKLAKANGEAIRGLQPKISVWNTGSDSSNSTDTMAPIKNLMQSLPPLFSTIADQTGITPPSWMARMPLQQGSEDNVGQERQVDRKGKGKALTNGSDK
jgi:flotillin